MDMIKKYMEAAYRSKEADIVLKGPWIVDVFGQNIYKSDIAIMDDMIVGVGTYSGRTEIDCEGLYVAPAFIDSHVHVESSKVIPEVYSKVVIKRGVTACIADPHEIANVLGASGIRFMLDNIRKSVIDIYLMMPSCVPAVDFEDNGAALDADELEKFISEKEVLGLGEVMDVPAVIGQKDDMLKKLFLFKDRVIDGHCPQAGGELLNTYIYSGVKTDHECSTPEQALEEVQKGMYVMLREGSAARNVRELLPAVNQKNFHRFLFCTDDRDISDLYREGSIDNNMRLAIQNGLDPIMAITMASLNAAQCYGLKNRGAVAPGYKADLCLLKSLKDVEILHVMKNGRIYEEEYGEADFNITSSSMNIEHVKREMFEIEAEQGSVNVIKVRKGSIETERVVREPVISDGLINSTAPGNSLKIGVFERHKKTGKFALGFIEGLGLSGCSVAQTIAHDSHNIIVTGDDDGDMEIAVNRVIDMMGGIAIAEKGRIVAELSLPVAGLMTHEGYKGTIDKLDKLEAFIGKHLEDKNINIFQTLAFMSLPVIPDIKVTTRGLYDFKECMFINLFNK